MYFFVEHCWSDQLIKESEIEKLTIKYLQIAINSNNLKILRFSSTLNVVIQLLYCLDNRELKSQGSLKIFF